VWLDGKPAGVIAPDGRLRIPRVSPGEHAIRIELAGKRLFTRKIVTDAGKPSHIRAPLADITGDLEVHTTPEARILVDGKPAGTADHTGRLVVHGLRAAAHTVRAGRVGFNAEERTVDVSADIVSTITLELRPIEALPPASNAPPPEFVIQRKLTGHTAGNIVPTFRSDSLQLLSQAITGDHFLRFWDPSSGREIASVEIDYGYVIAAISPDLKVLAVTTPGRATGFLALVDTATGKEIRRMPQQESDTVRAVFSPDASRLVTISRSREATIWDLEAGTALHSWKDRANEQVASSADGRWIATGNEDVSIREAATGKEVRRVPARTRVRHLTFSPDSRWLAVVNDRVDLWDPATGKQGRTIEPPAGEEFSTIEFTADSRFVGAAIDSAIRLWSIATGEQVRAWPFSHWSVNVAFSPDGKWMATGENIKETALSIWRRQN
jgi:WD40 repeat protein